MRAKRIATRKSRLVSLALTALLPLGGFASQASASGEFLPTGKQITPTAATGSTFQPLNPDLPGHPDFTAGQAVTTATSPDGKTVLILTSGYNSQNDSSGNTDPAQSNEYVFVYDISGAIPVKKQVLQVPNTFDGLAWNPNGLEFYVSGGPDDDVHIFDKSGATWSEPVGSPVTLGHTGGIGLGSFPSTAAGLAVTDDGKKLVVANFENDSVSVVNIMTRTKIGELDLRPGKINPATQSGVPGGEYPFWVSIKGHSKAYVSSIRDREIVVLDITVNPPTLKKRIHLNGKPNKLILNKAGTLLYAATDVTDTITVVDTTTDTVSREISTTAPSSVFSNPKGFKGSSPNSLVLSPDENTLYVTNGGTNSVAVIQLAGGGGPSVAGLIPTGWYPNSVSLNADGSVIYVVNGKSNAGPNPQNCKDKNGVATGNFGPCNAANQYVWQLTKAGFSVIPKPSNTDLTNLTVQVAQNNGFQTTPTVNKVMQLLGGQIKHVIYVVKENRTYDQVLGDLEIGNGDPSIVVFPEPITPNHHMLARGFVTLDNFYDSGEVSGDGWNWSTQARTTDSIEKTEPVNYAGRAFTYDWEGVNRNINVGYATVAERQAANPLTPNDPDRLPGTADIAAADGLEGEAGAGYLWDAALHAGLTVRNYGFFCDLTRYSLPSFLPAFLSPKLNNPDFGNALGSTVVAFPSKPALQSVTDSFYRGYDNKFPDFWRIKEWQREFDSYVTNGNLPNLEFVRIMHDHFGSFGAAVDGVNTIEKQMADNDYALGTLVDTVAHSPYADSTLIFAVEDDSQDGPDHVDAHRSLAYVIGPHLRQGKLVSTRYTTVNMVRTIEDVLGITPLNLNDGFEGPMTDVFEHGHKNWSYDAIVPDVLRTTSLPLPAATANAHRQSGIQLAHANPRYDAAYLEVLTRGMDFSVEDHVDAARFNRIVWSAMKGDSVPYPTKRDGRDLRHDRARLLKRVALPEKQARSIGHSAG